MNALVQISCVRAYFLPIKAAFVYNSFKSWLRRFLPCAITTISLKTINLPFAPKQGVRMNSIFPIPSLGVRIIKSHKKKGLNS